MLYKFFIVFIAFVIIIRCEQISAHTHITALPTLPAFTLQRGARQGCNISPDLFALYAEKIMKVAKDLDGIRVGGVNINNLRYADDTTLIADSETRLQNLLNSVVTESELNGLTLNKKSLPAWCSQNQQYNRAFCGK